MLARLAIVAGLVVGIAVAGVMLGGLVALAPDPPAPTIALPSIAVPSASPSAPASAEPSSLPPASPSGSGAVVGGAFHIGQPAPALVVPQRGGGTIDLGPDVMATGLKSILPGVDVTP